MKANAFITLIASVLLLASGHLFAQQAAPQHLYYSHSILLGSATTVSQDRSGFIYFLDPLRNLLRLDSLGRPLDTFSPPTRGRISSIEAWNPMKMLLFYEDRQAILLLDRFLRPITTADLRDMNYEGIAKAATLSADDGLWIFDETNLTLSKLDLRLRKVSAETPLNLILDRERFDVRQLREYQNMLYMLDYNTGIFVFDNMGNYKKTLPFKKASYIGFRGNDLYFVQDGQLIFHNLYTSETSKLTLPQGKNPFVSALVADRQLCLFTKDRAMIYRWE